MKTMLSVCMQITSARDVTSAIRSWTCSYVGLIAPFCGKTTYISWISSWKSLHYKLLNKQFWKWGTCAQWLHSVDLKQLNNSMYLLMIYWFFRKSILKFSHILEAPGKLYSSINLLFVCLYTLLSRGKDCLVSEMLIIHFLIGD